jgi:hypothetical protein
MISKEVSEAIAADKESGELKSGGESMIIVS